MKQGKIGFKSFVLQVAYAAYVVPRVDAPTQQTYDAKQTEQVSPPSFGKPWFYFDSERVDIVHPNAVGIGTLELQGVVTGGKVGKGEPVVMSELRPFVSRVQTEGIVDVFGSAQVESGKLEGEISLFGWQGE